MNFECNLVRLSSTATFGKYIHDTKLVPNKEASPGENGKEQKAKDKSTSQTRCWNKCIDFLQFDKIIFRDDMKTVYAVRCIILYKTSFVVEVMYQLLFT